jgi:hypothetical protein
MKYKVASFILTHLSTLISLYISSPTDHDCVTTKSKNKYSQQHDSQKWKIVKEEEVIINYTYLLKHNHFLSAIKIVLGEIIRPIHSEIFIEVNIMVQYLELWHSSLLVWNIVIHSAD